MVEKRDQAYRTVGHHEKHGDNLGYGVYTPQGYKQEGNDCRYQCGIEGLPGFAATTGRENGSVSVMGMTGLLPVPAKFWGQPEWNQWQMTG